MATINKTFSAKNGFDVANTIVIDSNRNLSNIAAANLTSLNVSANIANVGNLLVTQNVTAGNLAVTQNATFGNISAANIALTSAMNLVSLNVSANISNTGNLLVTQNTFTGNLSVTQNAAIGNITTTNISVGNLAATINVTAANVVATANMSAGNVAVTQNISVGNITATGIVTTPTMVVTSNLYVQGTTVTLNTGSLQSNDQYMILSSNNNLGDVLDYGIFGLSKNTTAGNVYSGLFKRASDELWHLVDGYGTTPNTSTITLASTNVATLVANIQANTVFVNGVNVMSTLLAAYAQANTQGTYQNGTSVVANTSNLNFINASQILWTLSANGPQTNVSASINGNAVFANGSVFVNGTLVANSPNLNIVSGNTSNISITGTSNTNPGNVTITIDTRLAAATGGGNYEADVLHNGGIVLANANLNYLDSTSILGTITANGTTQANLQFAVNATLNLTSLNVTSNIANAGNVLVSQNVVTGNISVGQNASSGNLSVTQNISTGNIAITQNLTAGNLSVANTNLTGSLTVNSLSITTNTVTLATVSQSVIDYFPSTGSFATAKYLVQANCQSSFYSTEIILVNDGTNITMDEFGTILTNGPVGTITAAITSGNVQLLFTANNATSTVVRTARYALAV